MPNLQGHALIQFLLSSFRPPAPPPSLQSDSRPTRIIIPEEDPQRPVHIEEDEGDGEETASGEGIGEEDEGEDEGDEVDDERETEPAEPAATSRIRKPGSQLIQDEHAAILSDLEARGANGLPSLYAKGSFFVHPKAPWFQLNGKRVTPTDLYRPRWFVWDPQALYKDLSCPTCGKTLHRHAAMSKPRRCVDLWYSFWIVGFRYRCRHCRHPTHPEPPPLQWTMPWQPTEHGHAP
ncbi:hypothetical protein DFP72DRAFT_1065656 [Ephemerocybe angulata]|uniref:Uncharacterized protein n=1 Tax=Ephemerocybe angulata TaxID=980116 RepID=A0A8H6M9S6_9AGAR|nr:hypothetical protein DFP72DRAFT_1065656 [Tulosesus angulatus]